MVHGDVVRDGNDTVVTITLAAEAAYDITDTEIITVTIPATATTSGLEIIAGNTFYIGYEAAGAETTTIEYVSGGPSIGYTATGISIVAP